MVNTTYRAYSGRLGKWVFGSCVHLPKLQKSLIFNLDYPEGIRVDPKSIGQMTGIADSHHRPIFEGDLLECSGATGTVFQSLENAQWEVVINTQGRGWKDKLTDWVDEAYIIGNSYQGRVNK